MAVIVVDPGHGGNRDVGGSSPNNSAGPAGTLEKTITLEFGLELRDVLVRQGHTVVMTRDSDVNLGLRARAAVARAQGADVFISLHCNGWHAADVQGSETWLHTRHNAASDRLAAAVQKQLVAATGLRDRGVKRKGLGVLDPDHHDPRTAACLVEVSFLTDPAEERRLNDASYRRRIVAHLAAGIGEVVGVPPTVQEVLDIGADASLPAEDAVKPTAGVSAAPSEPDL